MLPACGYSRWTPSPRTPSRATRPRCACSLGRSELTGYQASARGGMVQVRAEGERVLLAGRAVTVFAGHLSDAALPA